MKNCLLIFILFFTGMVSFAQTRSQLNFCRSEVGKLEKEVDKYKGFLEIQNDDLLALKLRIVDLNREVKILNHEKNNFILTTRIHLVLRPKYYLSGIIGGEFMGISKSINSYFYDSGSICLVSCALLYWLFFYCT